MTTDPDEYPAQCDVSAEELSKLKEAFEDEDSPVGERIHGDWPPSDLADNVYPIWFTVEDLDGYGKLRDSFGTRYDPFGGNLQPVSPDDYERCNAPLNNWRDRYPEVRFCGKTTNTYNGSYTYCPSHKGKKNMTESAEELMQTGLHAKTFDHFYEKLDPWKQLVGWGTYESLMGESTYEFGEEYKTKEFDFSDSPIAPDTVDDDGLVEVKVAYPTQHLDPSLSLFVAAMMGVQMLTVQPRIMYEDRENGEGMMESKTIETAQLTAPPSEHDQTPQQFKTLETWSEHHLNLPLSRLVTDRPKLLERGGVDPSTDSDSDGHDDRDLVFEIEADPDNVETKDTEGTDPNQFEDYTSESERIVDAVEGEDG